MLYFFPPRLVFIHFLCFLQHYTYQHQMLIFELLLYLTCKVLLPLMYLNLHHQSLWPLTLSVSCSFIQVCCKQVCCKQTYISVSFPIIVLSLCRTWNETSVPGMLKGVKNEASGALKAKVALWLWIFPFHSCLHLTHRDFVLTIQSINMSKQISIYASFLARNSIREPRSEYYQKPS